MANMNVSLPEPMRKWVENQVRGGRYGNASEYVRELIRRDQERQSQERLEQLLLEGLESGPAREMTRKDWDDLRQKLMDRHRKKLSGGKK